jgi:hypothetical protein
MIGGRKMDEIATRKWERAKEQSPVVFAAGAVSLFATWLFQNNPPNLVSEAVLKEALTVTVCILIGMGVVSVL